MVSTLWSAATKIKPHKTGDICKKMYTEKTLLDTGYENTEVVDDLLLSALFHMKRFSVSSYSHYAVVGAAIELQFKQLQKQTNEGQQPPDLGN